MRDASLVLIVVALAALYWVWPTGLLILLGVGMLVALILAMACAGHDGRRMKP